MTATEREPEEKYLDTLEGKNEIGIPDLQFDTAKRTAWTVKDGERSRTDLADALILSSETEPLAISGIRLHRPVLDIDVPARLIPSSTPGHTHLYFDMDCTWEEYEALLIAMSNCGILEEGYVRAALHRGATFVRLPWVKKKE